MLGLVTLGLTWTSWLPILATAVLPGLASRYADLELELEVVAVDLHHVELRDVRAHQRGAAPVLVSLRSPALSAEFDLKRLLKGDLSALARVAGERLVLDLRLDRLPPTTPPATTPSAPLVELPTRLPPLELDLWDVSVVLPGGVELKSQEGSLGVSEDSRLSAGELVVSGAGAEPTWSTQPLSLSGRWDGAVLDEVELTSGGRSLLHTSLIDLSRVLDGAVALDLHLALGQTGSGMRGTLDGLGAAAAFELEEVELAELAQHAPVELAVEPRGRLSAQGTLEVAWDDLAGLLAETQFRLEGAELGVRSLDRCEGSARLAEGWLEVSELSAEQPRNRLSLSELRWPLFAEDPQSWLRETSASLEVEVRDLAAITGPLPLPESYDELPRHELELAATIANGRVQVSRGRLETTGGEVTVREAELVAGATWDAPWSLRVRSDSQLDHLDQLGLLVGQTDWWGRLDGQLDVAGTWPRIEGSWQLSGRNLRFGELQLGALAVSLQADGERLEVRELRASGSDISLEATGSYGFATRQIEGGSLELDLPRLAPWAPGLLSAGSGKASARVAGPLGELRGSAELSAEGVEARGLLVQAFHSSVDGVGKSWRIPELHAETNLGTLDGRLELVLDEAWRIVRAEVHELELVREGEGLRLERAAALELSHEARLTGHLSDVLLAGEAGRFEIGGALTESGLELDARAEALRPDVFLGGLDLQLPSLARVDGEAEVRGDWGFLKFDTHGSLEGLRLPTATASSDLRWKMRRSGDTLEVEELQLSGQGGLQVTLQGALPTTLLVEDDPEQLSLEIDADLPPRELAALLGPDSLSASGSLRVQGSVAGTLEELSGDLEVSGAELRWTEDLHPPSLGDATLRGHVHLEKGLQVRDLALRFGDLVELEGQGVVEVPLNVREFVRDSRSVLDGVSLDASASIARLDLAALSTTLGPHLPQLERFRAGTLSGKLRASGPLREPTPSGELKIADATIRLGSGLPTADRLQIALLLEDRSFRIEEVHGELGGAPFTLTGDATLAGMQSELDFRLRGDDLLLYRSREAKVRANADLQLVGPLEQLNVRGKLDLSDGRFAPASEFLDLRGSPRARGARGFQLFHLREAPLSNLQFDIELTSVSPFVVRNTVIAGSIRPTLHLGGTGLLPVLTGEVYLDRTLMKLPASSLELTGGTVLFLPDDPFLPVVEISGRSRILGYDITATISGKYDSPEIVLSSTPPLSQESLLLLVLTGRLPEDPDQTDPLATANTVALYLAKDTLARWFTDDGPMDEDSVFNRFEFDAGRDVSRNGVETLDIAYRLTSKEDLPPERREKRHLYLAGQRDRFEDYNYGLRLVFRLKR